MPVGFRPHSREEAEAAAWAAPNAAHLRTELMLHPTVLAVALTLMPSLRHFNTRSTLSASVLRPSYAVSVSLLKKRPHSLQRNCRSIFPRARYVPLPTIFPLSILPYFLHLGFGQDMSKNCCFGPLSPILTPNKDKSL